MNKVYSCGRLLSAMFPGAAAFRKKLLSMLFAGMFLTPAIQAQITVTATGGVAMASYTTLGAAVVAINTGVHTGTITVDVVAGHTETLTARIDLTATGTMANPITIQKSGVGANPLLTAYTGVNTPTSNERDGMFSLSGSDWVTIDGIDLQDAAGNTDATTTMEYGYSLFKASDANGCQHNTIKNCTITLNRVNNAAWTGNGHNGSIGITVNNCTATVNTSITVTDASGSNSFNKFYSNTIQNCNAGISFTGYAAASPFDLGDTDNDVGGTDAATGNSVLNFGGGAGATQPATGIFANSQWGFNCSRNTINNNNGGGVDHPNTLRGIFMNSSSASANANCNFNTITVHGGGTTQQVTGIENAFGSTPAGNSINIRNNSVTGDYLTATSGVFYGIYNAAATPAFLNIEYNTVMGMTYSAAALTGSGVNYLIYNTASNANMTVNIRGNMVGNHSRTGTTGGTTIGIYNSSGTTGMSVNVKSNTVQNMNIDGAGTGSIMYGIQTATGTIAVDSNMVDNLNCLKTTGTGAMYGIYNISSPVDENYNLNTVSNLTHNGTGITYGMYTFTTTGTRTFSRNVVFNITSGGTTVAGINQASSSPNVFRNKVYNVQSTSSGAPTVSGILIGSLGTAGVANVYNNLVGNIEAPNASSSSATAPTVRGINVTTTTTNTMVNLSYNTVYLNASTSGANFATAALYVTTSTTATTANLTLLNNIFINLSTPSGTGNAVAYQRSSTSQTNYNDASNRNLFYAGMPGAANLLFFDGTNAYQTLAELKVGLAPKEQNSVTENLTFISTTGGSADFLHVNTAIPTQIESGGVNIAGITTDFDGVVRQGNTGYAGTGSAPDMGADEGEFILVDLSGPAITYTELPNSICTTPYTLSATITDATGVDVAAGTKPRLWYKKSTEDNVLPASNTSADNGWKYVEAVNASSPFEFNIDYSLLTGPATNGDVIEYFVVAQDVVMPPNVGTNIAVYPAGYVPASVALSAAAFPVSGYNSYSIIVSPVTITSSASPGTLCITGNVTLSLSGDPTTGAEYQWESSPAGANSWSPIVGATTATYVVNGVTASTDYRCVVSCGGVPIAASPSTVSSVLVNSPAVLSTTPGAECGPGPVSVTLGATASSGATLNWYDVVSGGMPIGMGGTFMTPPITTTTTYYVAASSGGGTDMGGRAEPFPTSTGFTGNNYGLVFDVTTEFTLNSIDVYSTAAGGAITIELTDDAGTVLQTAGPFTIPVGNGTTLGNGATPTTFTLDFTIPPGTGYRLRSANHSGNIIRDNPIGAVFSYPVPIGTVGNLTAGLLAGAVNANTHYYFYNWLITTGCESAREPVVATVINDPPVCPANITVCADAAPFALSGATPDGGVYSGPGVSNGTFSPAAAGAGTHTITYTACSLSCTFMITVNALPAAAIAIAENSGLAANDGILCEGASATLTASGGSSYAWSNGASTAEIMVSSAGAYTVTVTNASGCTSTATASIVVNPLPVVMISPADITICSGASATLTASGGSTYLWSPGGQTTPSINVTTAGTYSVVGTNMNGCSAGASANVTVNAIPELSQVSTQPTTCQSADGAINLTVSGAGGPYMYNWTTSNGSGIVQGQEDQSALTVGTYNVVVTDGNGCSASLSVSLTGPGNCEPCPAIGALVANPTGVCVNVPVTLTASGLVDMGTIYGITFKYATSPLANPYSGGTVIATIPNGSLGNGGTTAEATTSFATGSVYSIYAILDVPPADTACRPFRVISLPVVDIPSVNPVANQTVCNGTATAAVSFSGPVSGTIFNWTNSNPAIGLAASGTGDIASFAAVNNGAAPITATITVTPTTSATAGAVCTGSPVSFTITVNPVPVINAVTNQTYCAGASVPSVVFSSNVPGATFSWSRTNQAIGLGVNSGTGNVPAFTAANADTMPLTSTFSVVASFTNGGTTCASAPIQFTITVNPQPSASVSLTSQTVCNGSATTAINYTGAISGTVYNWTNSAPSIGLASSGTGNIASFTAVNTGGAPVTATITMTPVYSNGGVNCNGTPVVSTITVNPTAQVNQPANEVTCGGAPTNITFTTTTSGTTYSWTNSNPAIGLAASGTGNISFTAATVSISTSATITVTPNYTNNGVSCPGAPKTFTITVNPLPTVDPVSGQTMCSGTATAAVSFTGSLAGTVFNWTNSTPSIGLAASGSGNIASFVTQNTTPDIQVATITVTPVFNVTGGSCPGTPITFTITVYPLPLVNVGADLSICQNQKASLTAQLGGGATGGTWSGGAGTFSNANAATTNYTPAASEYGNTVTLTFTSNDPAGPCPAVSDALQLTVNTLPIVSAGVDVKICQDGVLSMSALGAAIQANGSGVTTGSWSTSGSGTFQPNNNFPAAVTYTPSAADVLAGFVTLTLTSADPAGPCNSVSDNALLTFKGPETLVCNDNVQVSLDQTGLALINPDMVLEGTYDDDFFTVSIYQNNVNIGNTVDCSQVGKTLQVRITDICTGVYCWGTIKIEDKLAPALTCSDVNLVCAITDYSPTYLQNTLGLLNAYPTVDENCDQYTLSHVDDWYDLTCDDNYSAYIRRVWTATDASGNKGTCTQFINFERKHVSDVVFPQDVTISCTGNVNTAPSATGAPYILAFGQQWSVYPVGGFCELQSAYTDQLLPVCDGTYKILRTWTVYDWCLPTNPTPPGANPAYFIQVIKVIDDQGPAIACPANVTVSTDPFGCCATTDLADVIVEDACSRVNSATARVVVRDQYTNEVVATYDLPGSLTTFPGNNIWDADTLAAFGFTPCLPLGNHTVTYTVEDACGNTSTCAYTLTVDDQTPPVVACDEHTQVALGASGMAFVNATTFDDGSYDNCSAVHFKARRMDQNDCQPNDMFYDQVKFCCSDINDTITVILRVYDVDVPADSVDIDFEEQNANDCMVQVFVEDKIKPTCNAPANVTISCEAFDPSLWAYGTATSQDNCCLDTITESRNYNLFDTLCNKGTITRTFRAFDCAGNSTQCTQRVFVNYEQDYFIKFPNDVIVTICDGTGMYGEPTFFGKDCELLGVSFEDEVFTVVPDACLKIERTWKIINWCTYNPNGGCVIVPNPNPNATSNSPQNLPGPIVSALGTPAPWNPTVIALQPGQAPTNFSVYYDPNANCYVYKQIIKIIDTHKPIVSNCPASPVEYCDVTANDPQLWNQSYWWDGVVGQHDLCEGDAALTITATDSCSGSYLTISYLLFLDLDGDGTMETVVSSNNTPAPGTVNYNNVGTPSYSGGTPQVFDGRPVLPNEIYRWALHQSVSGTARTASVQWKTFPQMPTPTNQFGSPGIAPQLPYGTHKIKWTITDGCGNETYCEYTFVVKDCKAPTVVCHNGLSVNIMPTQMIQLWATDFLQYAEDNCTPPTPTTPGPNQLVFAIRKAGQGTGFPVDALGNPITNVTFTCAELGMQEVELWAQDLAGNADFCQTFVDVQDNANNCNSDNVTVAGALTTEVGDGVEDANVNLQAGTVNLFDMSDDQGAYIFNNSVPKTRTTR
ncbi:MAG: hypothetical protein R2791_15865 [Saprospiraceae bacterium]